MPPQQPTGERPATIDEVITAIAKQHGVSPTLALAVAKKESNKTIGAVGDAGKAIGMFQLHDAAAQDAGITDRADPIQNITGGVKYLKQLSDRYQGDVNKTLMAYNGGMGNVDAGTISPAAQAYAAEVIANLSANMRETSAGPGGPGRAAGAGPIGGRGVGAGPGPRADLIKTDLPSPTGLLKPFDPRTAEGRQNLAATGGSIAATALTRGLPVGSLLTTIARVVGPVVGAGSAAATDVAVERAAGVDAYAADPNAALKAGVSQAGMEALGGTLLWPVRRLTRAIVAPNVVAATKKTLQTSLDTARQTGRDLIDSVVRQTQDILRTTKLAGRQAVDVAAEQGAEHVAKARSFAASALARVEESSAEHLDLITKQLDDLAQQAPSKLAAGGAVRDVVPLLKKTLELAGQRVSAAADSGPVLSITPVKATLTAITNKAKPPALFPQAAERGAGFLPAGSRAVPTIGARPAHAPAAAATMSREEFKQFLHGQLASPAQDRLPLTGILDVVAKAPDELAFADAHALKMLLDERVTWDRPAKAINERLTKATRTALREVMAGHEDYNVATAAYQSVVQLQRKGVGARILKLAQQPDGADKLATILKGNNPASALTVKSLLIDQAAASGDTLQGQRAWNAVRSVYTFDQLIAGGADTLGKRIQTLLAEQPDFARVVYGDETGKTILTNLGTLAEALQVAKANAAQATTQQVAIGKAGIAEAKDVAGRAVTSAKRNVDETIAKVQQDAALRRQTAARTATRGVQDVKATAQKFGDSKLAKAAGQSVDSVLADMARATALGPQSFWGAQSIWRLIRHSPQAPEILEWAAYSKYNTSRLTKFILGDASPALTAALFRDLGSVLAPGDQPLSAALPPSPPATASTGAGR